MGTFEASRDAQNAEFCTIYPRPTAANLHHANIILCGPIVYDASLFSSTHLLMVSKIKIG
jgi:hypothetical protein